MSSLSNSFDPRALEAGIASRLSLEVSLVQKAAYPPGQLQSRFNQAARAHIYEKYVMIPLWVGAGLITGANLIYGAPIPLFIAFAASILGLYACEKTFSKKLLVEQIKRDAYRNGPA